MRCPACANTDLADHQFIQGHHVFICKNPMCGQWLERVTRMRVIGHNFSDLEVSAVEYVDDQRLLAILAEEG